MFIPPREEVWLLVVTWFNQWVEWHVDDLRLDGARAHQAINDLAVPHKGADEQRVRT